MLLPWPERVARYAEIAVEILQVPTECGERAIDAICQLLVRQAGVNQFQELDFARRLFAEQAWLPL